MSLVWTVTWSIDGNEPLREAWKASAEPAAMVELLLYLDDSASAGWLALESVCRVLRAPHSTSWRKLRTEGFGGTRASPIDTMKNMVRAATRTQTQSAYRMNGIRFLCDTIRKEVPFPYELPDLMRELARFT